MERFPTTPDDIDGAFLSAALDSQVVSCSSVPIGAGLVGDSARISIEYAHPNGGPATIAAKFPAADPTSKGTAVSMQLYEREVGFYREIAPHIGTRTPIAYFAEHEEESGNFLLLMEDCGPAQQGDQLASCSVSQARAAIKALAALHGPTYENPEYQNLPFLAPNPDVRAFAAAGYPGASEKFSSTYAGKIPDDVLAYICSLADHSEQYFLGESGPAPCVVHGDFRLDNMLFDIAGGTEPVAILDWQTIALGHPLTDLGYFMGAGIGSGLRRENDVEFLELYRGELVAQGGPDLGNIRVSDEYARGALHGISTAVFSAAFVEHTDRSEAIFQSMAVGGAELAMEIDAMRILEGVDGAE